MRGNIETTGSAYLLPPPPPEGLIQPPTVGRIVHYQPSNRLTPLAAIIVDVCVEQGDGLVNLTVFQPEGTTKPAKNVKHSTTLNEYCWSWPAR